MSQRGEGMERFKRWRFWVSGPSQVIKASSDLQTGWARDLPQKHDSENLQTWSLPVKFCLNGANLDHVVRLLFLQTRPLSVENNGKTMWKLSDRIKGPHLAGPAGSATTLKCCFPWLTSASPCSEKVRATMSYLIFWLNTCYRKRGFSTSIQYVDLNSAILRSLNGARFMAIVCICCHCCQWSLSLVTWNTHCLVGRLQYLVSWLAGWLAWLSDYVGFLATCRLRLGRRLSSYVGRWLSKGSSTMPAPTVACKRHNLYNMWNQLFNSNWSNWLQLTTL